MRDSCFHVLLTLAVDSPVTPTTQKSAPAGGNCTCVPLSNIICLTSSERSSNNHCTLFGAIATDLVKALVTYTPESKQSQFVKANLAASCTYNLRRLRGKHGLGSGDRVRISSQKNAIMVLVVIAGLRSKDATIGRRHIQANASFFFYMLKELSFPSGDGVVQFVVYVEGVKASSVLGKGDDMLAEDQIFVVSYTQ